MSPGPEIRIGDSDREAAATALGEHYAAGRLTKEEYDERADRAWKARTRSEFAPLFADLPAPHGLPASGAPTSAVANGRPGELRTRDAGLLSQIAAWPCRLVARMWWPMLVVVMVLALFGRVPWFVVAILAALWFTGVVPRGSRGRRGTPAPFPAGPGDQRGVARGRR